MRAETGSLLDMPKPMDGFTVDLPELEKIASQDLPAVASALRAPTNVLMAHEGLEGPGRLQAVYTMEGAYAHFTDSVALRQRAGCDRIDATAEALRDIASLYRRADGQMGSVDVADWKTDSELYEIADQLANKIMQMYTAAGVFIPVGQKRDAVLESVRLDAETYMSLDPQKIVDEFQRMQRASKNTGEAAVATSLLRAANIKISSTWRGDMASMGTHGDRRATRVEAAAPFSRHV